MRSHPRKHTGPDPVRLSKFMSLVLRHDPGAAGLTLDGEGWVDVDALVAGCVRAGLAADRAGVEHVSVTSDKRRFALRACLSRLRVGPAVLFRAGCVRGLPRCEGIGGCAPFFPTRKIPRWPSAAAYSNRL